MKQLGAVAGSDSRGDALVHIRTLAGDESSSVEISSPVRELFAPQQDRVISDTLDEFVVGPVRLEIQDNHAVDWVLKARIRAALSRLEAE